MKKTPEKPLEKLTKAELIERFGLLYRLNEHLINQNAGLRAEKSPPEKKEFHDLKKKLVSHEVRINRIHHFSQEVIEMIHGMEADDEDGADIVLHAALSNIIRMSYHD